MTPDDSKYKERVEEGGEPRGLPHAIRLSLIGLSLGVAFEVLFYGHPLGVSFVIWAALCVAGLAVAAALEAIPLQLGRLWLAVPILFLAAMTSLRSEPMSVLLDVVLTLALLTLWVRSFRTGRLVDFGWLDFGLALGWVPIEAFVRPWPTLSIVQKGLIGERGGRSRLFAALRGVILAIPILAVFLVLLSAADLIFGEYVETALRWFDLTRLVDWAGRGLVILIVSVFCMGAMVTALRLDSGRRLLADRGALIHSFLGFTEASIVLASVDLLFSLFVIVQLAYFFGGEANVTAAGFTYSEYARRGFGELVAVGVLSLGLIMALAAVTRRETRRQTTWFNALSAGLVILVGIILISALKRLLLYEQAYGFTRLRTYTHVAIVWMAVVFLAFLILLVGGRLRRFAPVCAAAAVGFAATLNLLNVDAFIVNRNADRLAATGDLDVAYLATLSVDALPGLTELATDAPAKQREALLPELACWNRQLRSRQEEIAWQSANFGRIAGLRALSSILPSLSAISVEQDQGVWRVGEGDDTHRCLHQPWGIRMD
jgi:hypothetical protein